MENEIVVCWYSSNIDPSRPIIYDIKFTKDCNQCEETENVQKTFFKDVKHLENDLDKKIGIFKNAHVGLMIVYDFIESYYEKTEDDDMKTIEI